MQKKPLLKMLFVICGLMPFFSSVKESSKETADFKSWPTTFEGQPLGELPISEDEKTFNADFPGKMARFTDGSREILLRWIKRESRKLHPAQDCFKAYGYSTEPLPVKLDSENRAWSCIKASKINTILRVCELIIDEKGNSWSEPSAWYWNALFQKTEGPWLAFIVAENY